MHAVLGASSRHVSRMLEEAGAVEPRALKATLLATLGSRARIQGPGNLACRSPAGLCLREVVPTAVLGSDELSCRRYGQYRCGSRACTAEGRPGGIFQSVDTCAVCMDQPPGVAFDGCRHLLCFQCACCIVKEGIGCRPVLCPFVGGISQALSCQSK